MRTHVALEVEVGKLLTLLHLEKTLKLLVGIDLATIVLVLQTVLANIVINVASHIGAGKKGTGGILKEGGKFLANKSSLGETTRLTLTGLPLLLGLEPLKLRRQLNRLMLYNP